LLAPSRSTRFPYTTLFRSRLDAAYALGLQQSSAFYHLFSVYGEADNLFRQYTIDFNEDTYGEYRDKLDTIKYYIDSLSTLPNTKDRKSTRLNSSHVKNSYA